MSEVRMLTVKQVADRLQVKATTVQRWLKGEKMQGTKLPGKAGWRVPIEEVERWERGER
jgi:excisionase family DNA binding protein